MTYVPFCVFGTIGTRVLMYSGIIRGSSSGVMPVYYVLALILLNALVTIVEVFYFRNCGNLYDTSVELKTRVLRSSSKVVQIEGKSLQLLGFNVGHFFKIKRSTTLRYFSQLRDYTITILLY